MWATIKTKLADPIKTYVDSIQTAVDAAMDNLGWLKITSATAATSAALNFTSGIGSDHTCYRFYVNNLRPATDGQTLRFQISDDGGSTYEADATDYEYSSAAIDSDTDGWNTDGEPSQGQTYIPLLFSMGNVATETAFGWVDLFDPSNTTSYKHIQWKLQCFSDAATAVLRGEYGIGAHNGGDASAAAVNACRFIMSSGNLTSGTITMYGLID